jgi:hypothetical protein
MPTARQLAAFKRQYEGIEPFAEDTVLLDPQTIRPGGKSCRVIKENDYQMIQACKIADFMARGGDDDDEDEEIKSTDSREGRTGIRKITLTTQKTAAGKSRTTRTGNANVCHGRPGRTRTNTGKHKIGRFGLQSFDRYGCRCVNYLGKTGRSIQHGEIPEEEWIQLT